jgi:mannitol/fructose-specific phosphotransferase system IIA component (Ntr-type)/ABC-type transporter Mla MlaB component
VGWHRLRPKALALVPGQLLALVVVTGATVLLRADVVYLDISPRFFDGLAPTSIADFGVLLDAKIIGLSFVFAFVASAATLLTATAIDQRQTHSKANYDRELFAQGVGNVLTGAVGGLPMTGVIVRSSVNVDAGARTRRSTILHGIWILLFVSAAPEALEHIPQASLGAILVFTGYKLVDRRALVALYRQGRAELAICLITLFGVVFVDLFAGILAGLAAAVGKIVYTFARLEIRSEPDASRLVQDLHLTGSATFFQLPRLAKALEAVPADRELHVHVDQLDHIDHACLQLLSSWNQRRESEGRPGMVVEWAELTQRYRNALVGGARDDPPTHSMMSMIWAEWKRIYAPGPEVKPESAGRDAFIDVSRARVQIAARSLDDVVAAAAEALAPAAGRSAADLGAALRDRIEGHVALGGGVSVPHTPIPGLDRSLAALITTREPLDVSGQDTDIFFVLLAPSEDPRQHLQSLAHVGRLCHDHALLEALRVATTAEDAVRAIEAVDRAVVDTDAESAAGARLLAVVEVEGEAQMRRVGRLVDQAFGKVAVGPAEVAEAFGLLRRTLHLAATQHLVLASIDERDVAVLRALLDEESRLVGGAHCAVHLLRADTPLGARSGDLSPQRGPF